MYDCHTHPLGHEGGDYTIERLRPFVERGMAAGLKGLAFTDHEWYHRQIDAEVVERLREEYPSFKVLLGLEVDYKPGREEELREIIAEKPYDFVIGSVHHLGSWEFDHPDYRDKYNRWDINALFEEYFTVVAQAVETGLFQQVGHFDLIKVFGYRYQGELLEVVEPVLQKIKEQGMVVEVNTNGLNKPVQEAYPTREIIQRCLALDIPLTLSSDAHEPRQVGQYFNKIRPLLRSMGCRQLAHFEQKKMVIEDF
ncbi:MAG: histidinol-phosphatase HisJ family protein [Clostridia bacterium]|nr:histidinol-phosphatase HisJ family protein [Clostridia bacterium]